MNGDQPAQAIRQRGESGVKLIQVCASYNDLFGLDEDGQPYTYNFHTNTWTRLGPLQSDGTTERAARAIDTR
jgi:hypothetical protein